MGPGFSGEDKHSLKVATYVWTSSLNIPPSSLSGLVVSSLRAWSMLAKVVLWYRIALKVSSNASILMFLSSNSCKSAGSTYCCQLLRLSISSSSERDGRFRPMVFCPRSFTKSAITMSEPRPTSCPLPSARASRAASASPASSKPTKARPVGMPPRQVTISVDPSTSRGTAQKGWKNSAISSLVTEGSRFRKKRVLACEVKNDFVGISPSTINLGPSFLSGSKPPGPSWAPVEMSSRLAALYRIGC
mmetsp:Transcript_22203/g.63677  ORF Transcript_22203/g.63677 Transcript_22203/m.63677 type:complete len:246 (+) Transcript_22203:218-955(+)